MKRIIEPGTKFGHLVVKTNSYIHGKNRKYECLCTLCNETDYFFGNNLKKGNTTKCKSCAAVEASEQFRTGARVMSYKNTGRLGGLSQSAQYNAYKTMLNRCYNPNSIQYEDYGGRGIFVCDDWRFDYAKFYKDMGPRPEGMSIERLNVNDGYYPANCRWATFKEQARNKRNTILIEHNGETLSMADWADILGVSYNYLAKRRQMGRDMNKLITDLMERNNMKIEDQQPCIYNEEEVQQVEVVTTTKEWKAV